MEETIKRDEQGRFVPGQTGNPNGRPKGSISMVDKLRQYLQDHPEEADKLISSLIQQGTTGNTVAIKEILDRIDGKVTDTHRIEGDIPISIIYKQVEKDAPIKEEE